MASYKALYRKWRPSVFSDVIGQEHITTVLKSEIMSGTVSHAYLFCGSRGTGKTTCAKILSKAVSCENPIDGDPCGVCPTCIAAENSLDIYEIDAASNNGVDDIRELRDTVVYPPSEMKKRVYIIDEVHMLSEAAFNALLKTLEEPPEHALFILATTELKKIPATILSRCKRFDFHRITAEKIRSRLRLIADSENINITDSALLLIARLATGAMRDALSMLELFTMSETEITEELAAVRLGVVGKAIVFSLLDAIVSGNSGRALEIVGEAYDGSKDLGVLCSELSDTLRDILVVKYSASPEKLIDATDADIATLRGFASRMTDEKIMFCSDICEEMQNKLSKGALSARTVTETMMIRMCEPSLSADIPSLLARIAALEAKISGLNTAPLATAAAQSIQTPIGAVSPSPTDAPVPPTATPEISTDEAPPPGDGDIPFDGPYTDTPPKAEEVIKPKALSPRPLSRPKVTVPADEARKPFDDYSEFVEEISETNKMISSVLSGGVLYLSEDATAELQLASAFAPILLSKPENSAILTAALAKLTGKQYQIKVKLVKAQNGAELPDLSTLN